jgi:hypothetical protein
MRRALTVSTFVLALAALPLAAQDKPALPLAGQDKPSPSPSGKPEAAKPVLLSGCLTGGPSSYTLSNVAVTRVAHEAADRPAGTSGASTSYSLTGRDGVNLGDYVGKKVEVSGALLPSTPPQKDTLPGAAAKQGGSSSADAKAQTRADVAAATDPKLAVTSVKLLSATCQ